MITGVGAHQSVRSHYYRCCGGASWHQSPRLLERRRRRAAGGSSWISTAATTVLLYWQLPQPAVVQLVAGLGAMSDRSITTSTSSQMNRKIAVAQLCSTDCKLANLLNVAQCAGWASREKCSILFLPECFGFLGTSAEQTLAAAEPCIDVVDDEKDLQPKALRNSDQVTRALIEQVRKSAETGMFDSNDLGTLEKREPTTSTSTLTKEEDRCISVLDALRTIARETQLWISGGGMHVAVPDEPRVYNTHVIVDHLGELRSLYRKMHLFDVCIPGKVDLRESKTTKAGDQLVLCRDSPIGTCLENITLFHLL